MTNWAVANGLFSPDNPLIPGFLLGAQGHLPDALSGATPLGIVKEGISRGLTPQALINEHGITYGKLFWDT